MRHRCFPSTVLIVCKSQAVHISKDMIGASASIFIDHLPGEWVMSCTFPVPISLHKQRSRLETIPSLKKIFIAAVPAEGSTTPRPPRWLGTFDRAGADRTTEKKPDRRTTLRVESWMSSIRFTPTPSPSGELFLGPSVLALVYFFDGGYSRRRVSDLTGFLG